MKSPWSIDVGETGASNLCFSLGPSNGMAAGVTPVAIDGGDWVYDQVAGGGGVGRGSCSMEGKLQKEEEKRERREREKKGNKKKQGKSWP